MRLADAIITALIGTRLAAGLAMMRLDRGRGLDSRLGDLPTDGLPLSRPVTIHWNRHQVPFIEAETDGDAAFALGMVHAHLRLAQIEVMRRLAHGRLSEMFGPAAVAMDHGLRLLDFPRAVPAILARMPGATLAWTRAFAAGLSHVAAHAPLPPEFPMLGLERAAWSAADVVAVGRMASADVNWVLLFNMLKLRDRADWPRLWAGLVGHEGIRLDDGALLGRIATGATRAGSNALAVAGSRSASGAALMAADPHLTLTLPNPWLAAGLKCPSIHAAGLMIPGLPVFAIGRNPAVAWSGTSLQAASTDLFDATTLKTTSRRQTIRIRHGKPREVTLRDTALGPVVTDCGLLGGRTSLAMKWVGHQPSDELTAWLAVARSTDWTSFCAAAEGMAVPGQGLVFADHTGRIGKLLAAHLPSRPDTPPADCVLSPEEAGPWRRMVSSSRLPRTIDPPSGVVASANERPHRPAFRVGSFFPGPGRYVRLQRLVRGRERLGLDDLAALQRDVFSESSLDLAAWICARTDHPILAGWDGCYDVDSRGAAALEHMVAHLHGFAQDGPDTYWASWDPVTILRRRLEAADPAALARALAAAAEDDPPRWGDIHRLRLGHGLGMLPGLELLARMVDLPAPGGNDTIHKTAHGLAAGSRHPVRFGADARFLTDLGDPDSSRVVLLGGQDGWPGSTTFLDQLPLWRDGRTMALPLRPETVRATFTTRTILKP